MANGHQAHEEKPSCEELKTEVQENGGEEAMEVTGGEDEEKVGETLQNGAHERFGEGQETEEKEKEANLIQNRKTRGKVAEGKNELMHSQAVLRFTPDLSIR